MKDNKYAYEEHYQDYETAHSVGYRILKLLGESQLTYNDFNLIMEMIKDEIKFFTFVSVDNEKQYN